MEETVEVSLLVRRAEAGFSLLDLVVALAMLSGVLLIACSTFGFRPSSVHPAALALEAAISEARSIATMQQADGTDPGLPTGATVSVEVDPHDAARSIITVYKSRSIPNPDKPIYSPTVLTGALPVDIGFPPQTVSAVFTIVQTGAAKRSGAFTIMISSSGYTSIETGAYVPGKFFLTDDGCSDAGTTISAASGGAVESHPFVCRTAVYEASV